MAETFLHTVVAAASEYAIDVLNIVGNEYGWSTISGNPCNACNPPIPDTLYVTFAGLAGDLAIWNGKHAVLWWSECFWRLTSNPPNDYPQVTIVYYYSGGAWRWIVTAAAVAGTRCAKSFANTGSPDTCHPELASYSEYTCLDTNCTDTDTCADSVGATCVVSLI